MIKPTIYEIRSTGRHLCDTEGSKHYKSENGAQEPIEFSIDHGWGEGFCKGNVIKYVTRYDQTGDMKDLIKAADYHHILIGLEAGKIKKEDHKNGREDGVHRTGCV